MVIDIFDVQLGQCAIIHSPIANGPIAMVDCGHSAEAGWTPSFHLRHRLNRTHIDYLFITNADQDHFSHLADLTAQRIGIGSFFRNGLVTPEQMRQLKLAEGPLTDDAREYLRLHSEYVHPVVVPFDQAMGGISYKGFCCSYPAFTNTNDLSLAAFFSFSGFEILFPGDLTENAWRELLRNPEFVAHLGNVNVLVAAHHGRRDGYCPEVFDHCHPQLVIFSDKSVDHETQLTASLYAQHVVESNLLVNGKRRKVVTTRNDGDIRITVGPQTYGVWTGQL